MNLDSNLDASSPFAPPPDAWSTPLTPEVLGEMTVIGFWEPGRGLDPLPALHLMAGARGPSARLVGDDAVYTDGDADFCEACGSGRSGLRKLDAAARIREALDDDEDSPHITVSPAGRVCGLPPSAHSFKPSSFSHGHSSQTGTRGKPLCVPCL